MNNKLSNEQRRLTTEQFIERSQVAHGCMYCYDKVKYVNYKTKVEIVCSKHGSFMQSPNKHLNGTGCPKCANKRVTTEEFIQKCREVHGDRYDYSRVKYKPGYTKIEILCPEHGPFFQVTYNHLSNKQGCPSCKHEKAKNNIGYINDQFFESQPSKKDDPCWFYVVKCYDGRESFYKVGITIQNVPKDRWYSIPYTVDEVCVERTTLYEAFIKEQQVKLDHLADRYLPLKHFNGYTECFTHLDF